MAPTVEAAIACLLPLLTARAEIGRPAYWAWHHSKPTFTAPDRSSARSLNTPRPSGPQRSGRNGSQSRYQVLVGHVMRGRIWRLALFMATVAGVVVAGGAGVRPL